MGRWTTIKVPRELHTLIKRLAEKHKKSIWQIVHDAISFYDALWKSASRRAKLSDVEKVSWYITKLALAYSNYALNPSQDTLLNLKEKLKEVKDRMGVDTSILESFAEYYMRFPDEEMRKRARIDMNQAFKVIIKEMILRTMFEEVSKQQP